LRETTPLPSHRNAPTVNKPHLPVWMRGIFIILSLVGIGLLLKNVGLDHIFDREWINTNVRGHGLKGYVVYLAAGAIICAVGLPRQMVAFFGGYAFGVLTGTVLAAAAALGGCILAFYYARLFGRAVVKRLFPERLRRFDNFVRDDPFSMTLLIRLLPVGSNLITNLVAGVSGIRKSGFFAGSFVGYLPQALIFALAGDGLTVESHWRIGSSIVLFLLAGLLALPLYRRMRHGQTYDEALEVDESPKA
jgi:uncharacterized membrane protein YdjX (TVP38/TMEM64 family)